MANALLNPPKQARSRERLQRVLDAAETVLSDEGAAALSTTRIATVAGVAVGSVYRFFPDKEAIVEALALSYWSEFGEAVEALDVDAVDDPVGLVIDTLAEAFRATPGFRALWFGGLRTERLRDVTRPVRARFNEAVAQILAVARPDADPNLRAATARMLVLTGDALLREAFRLNPAGDEVLLAETKLMVASYIDKRLGG